ncbi:MAG: hypothetical protein L3J44_09630, partial [Campylobacteraceae bacterium]|nr:hypothetical protein [Campylobacteraceae bacterium]
YRIVNSFFMGFAFVSLLDFLYFIGIKLHYFDFYKINEYFNVIFIDNQNFYILIPTFFIAGYLLLYCKFSKIFMRIYLLFIFLMALSIYEPIGRYLGEFNFMQVDKNFKVGSTIFKANLLYKGRKYIYMYRNDISKTVKIKKDEVEVIK